MAKENKDKLVKEITSRDTDFAQWYTDVVKKAALADYSTVKGCMIIRPYGYAIWENIQKTLDKMFKETGHENVYMPMLIPESLLQIEKDHVEGFAPEVAWVTHGGNEKLTERLCIRPTSETLFCQHYKNIIHSYRDLPMLYNQWCSVMRWEKTTRPFLRTTEFLWQEGHTMHETAEEAREETRRMLNTYADFLENYMAVPVTKGQKTDKEKFAGAEETYTVEAMMHDGKALQSGTSHYFGDGFAKAFEIQFAGRDNKLTFPHQTSWGVSTRMIGALIMVHGDDDGLVIPPKIAPVQLVIVPVAMQKPGVLDKARELFAALKPQFRVQLDDSDKMPGWKFAEHEMRGVPLRMEIGPKDIEKGQCVLVRRDTREKYFVPLEGVETKISELLDEIQKSMFERAKTFRESHIYDAATYDEMKKTAEEKPGFINAMWCGDVECEEKIKDEVGLSSRCMPFEQKHVSDVCVCCGKPAKAMVIWGKSY
ncbi:MAG: proline--tRNA ligase [Clostridia bacterium]|nr:proline--tRNA ligase [Clostridia bacterium]